LGHGARGVDVASQVEAMGTGDGFARPYTSDRARTEPVLTLVFLRGWTMGQAQQGGAREESVGANNLLSVPEGLHGE